MTDTERKALAELEASVLFDDDFPKRSAVSDAEYKTPSNVEKSEARSPSSQAMQLAGGSTWRFESIVRELGAAKYEPAVPSLCRLWRECALLPVRAAVGHALFDIGTAEAWSALEAMIDDYDHLSQHLAIKVIFTRNSSTAYDVLSPRFDEANSVSPSLPHAVLAYLIPVFGYSQNVDPEERHTPELLKIDPRWLDLCARLRRDHAYGDAARDILNHCAIADTDEALKNARALEAQMPAPAPPRVERDGTLPARYNAGEFETVWHEIRSQARIDGEFREEVLEVAEATMYRVRDNANLISERLRERGWIALMAEDSDLRTAPSSDDAAVFERIAEITECPVPPTLLAFWKIVGGINWVWNYNHELPAPDLGVDLQMVEMDPLCIDPPAVMPYRFDGWMEQKNRHDPDLIDPFLIELAPDCFHKANYSGGMPYCVSLPFYGADPVLDYERHELPFVDYLRLCFRWAGFPGLEEHADRSDVRQFVKEFGAGLVPF